MALISPSGTTVIVLADRANRGRDLQPLNGLCPFKHLPQIQVPVLRIPFVNTFVFACCMDRALSCSGTLVVGLFTYSLTAGETLGSWQASLGPSLAYNRQLGLNLFEHLIRSVFIDWV